MASDVAAVGGRSDEVAGPAGCSQVDISWSSGDDSPEAVSRVETQSTATRRSRHARPISVVDRKLADELVDDDHSPYNEVRISALDTVRYKSVLCEIR